VPCCSRRSLASAPRAEARGYEYYAVTNHAPNLAMQRMTDEKTLAQRAELRARGHGRHGPAVPSLDAYSVVRLGA
jgi:hypothetical protein